MSRWKLVVGMTVGLALFGCKPPVEPPPPGGDVVAPPAVDEDLKKAKGLVEEGRDLLAEGELDEAKAKAAEALALKPDLQDAKDLLAEVEAKEETTTAAGRAAAAARKKAQIAQLLEEGKALLKQGKLDGAKAKVDEALDLDAENADAKKLAGDIAQAKAEDDVGRKLAEQKAALKTEADTHRARGKWEAAETAYKDLLEIETDARKKAAIRESADYCRAMKLYGVGQEAEKAGRLVEAQKYYAEAYKMKKLRLFKDALDRVTETRREEAKKEAETKLCAELMASADSLAAEGKLKEAILALREIAKLKYAPEGKARQAAEKQAALTKELNYGQCVAAAEAALAAEPPAYAKAAEEYLRAKQFKDLTAEQQEKLIECKFQQAVQNGDAAAEAAEGEVPNYAEAIDYYEEALSYKEDEAVAAKLDGVKAVKAAADFGSFVETGNAAMDEGRLADAVGAYELAVKLADESPEAFADKGREVAGAKSKLKKAKVQLDKKLSVELAAKWKALLKEIRPLKKQPTELKAKLVEQQETFKDSKYAAQLAKQLSVAEKGIDKALGQDWAKVKKQVKKGKDRQVNIQVLADFLEKVRGTNYEEQVQIELDAQKQALEEAPPEEPVEPEPVEDAAAPEAPPEPVEEAPAG